MRLIKEVLPLPVEPRTPINCPGVILILMFSNVFFSAVFEYLKFTLSNTIDPSLTSMTGFSGFLIVGSSRRTSPIRRIPSKDKTSMTIIMEIIIKDIKI